MLTTSDSSTKMDAGYIGELEQHWDSVETALREFISKGNLDDSVASQIVQLCNHGMLHILELWLLSFSEEIIMNTMLSFFSLTKELDDVLPNLRAAAEDIDRLVLAARYLTLKTRSPGDSNANFTLPNHKLDIEEEILKLSSRLSTSMVTAEFDSLMLELFQRSFRAFHKAQSADDCSGLVFCPGCNADIADDENLCSCGSIIHEFVEINEVMSRIGVFPSLVHDCVQSVCFDLIKKHVVETCQGDFENKCASNLEHWLNETVVSWLQTISGQTTSMISAFKNNLLFFLHDIFIEFRAGQLFDMIVDFPDSQPALEDLRDCIQKVRSLDELVAKLKQAMTTRLFHPGVKTADIITAYVSTIKALRILDPSGFILQSICDELSVYLKSRDNRDNTVRIIVSSLTDETNVELNAELAKCAQKPPTHGSYLDGSSDDESDWQKWVPQAKVSRIIKSSDIITLLVNIYGSKEVFVEEYASLLSERLLNGNSDTQREIMYMELLKVRFGELAMNNCEVMLNDVKYSKRLHSQIIQEKLSDQLKVPLDSLIISAQFWPELKDLTIKIPDNVTEDFEKFRKEYEILNGNRTVNLRPNLGYVELDLELESGAVKSIKCTTPQATLIKLFHERNHWRMADIATALECSRITVKRLVAFWTQQGILVEGGPGPDGVVVAGSDADVGIVEPTSGNKSFADEEMEGDEDDDCEGQSRPNQLQETRYQTFSNFVQGLLTNLGDVPLDRIYSMLKMFAASSWADFTIQDCKQFMDSKVKSGDVLYSSGLYSLPSQ